MDAHQNLIIGEEGVIGSGGDSNAKESLSFCLLTYIYKEEAMRVHISDPLQCALS